MVGLVALLVGGLAAGASLTASGKRRTAVVAPGAGLTETLDPTTAVAEPSVPARLRRFLFGAGLFVYGAVTVVLAG